MNGPLLQTKLYIPPVRPELVPRTRLIERLDAGLDLGHRLTLVSAPAGFGKTTLLSEWVRGLGERRGAATRVAWLSLDEGDNDPVRFLAYLAAALGVGEGAGEVLHGTPPGRGLGATVGGQGPGAAGKAAEGGVGEEGGVLHGTPPGRGFGATVGVAAAVGRSAIKSPTRERAPRLRRGWGRVNLALG